MKEIAVVIPNYNGRTYLTDCLMALEQETRDPQTPEFEVIVVDNGSTDGSVPLLTEQWPRVRKILLQENTGFCHAVNVGIQASQAPYVILLNNDTKIKSGFIKGLHRAINRDPKAFSVSARMLMWDRPELVDDAGDYYCALGWAFARGKGRPAEQYDRPVKVFSACGGAAIYRRSVFAEIGLFDEAHFAYLEDLDIGYRAKIYGYHNLYEPSARVLHYGSASSGSRYNEWKTRLASANSVYVIGKNMPLLQILWNLPLLLVGYFIKFLFFCRKKMGMTYLKGCARGLARCFSVEGRRNRVPFRLKNLKNYLVIQWELWANFLRFLKK
ncbi:MAG: glycosyltransferase family 2 protein [Lachnospiraceae bacterium]|nr:glycosyltransferase family 2 protein [Lachnospiraceae bacterium]